MGFDCFAVASASAVLPESTVIPALPAREPTPPRRQTPARKSAPPVSVDSPVANPSTRENAVDTVKDLRLVLEFFRVGKRLAVVNELPWLADATASREQMVLLDRILIALGKPATSTLGGPELVFRWPVDDSADLSGDFAKASQMLNGMLQARMSLGGFDWLLVLSPQCQAMLGPQGVTKFSGPVVLPELGCKAVFTHSLGAMLAVPSLKRSVWEAIQPLVGSLSDSE